MEDQVHRYFIGQDENNIETYKSNISKTIAQVPNIEVIVGEDQQPKDEKNVLVDIRTWWKASRYIQHDGNADVATGLFGYHLLYCWIWGYTNTMLMSVLKERVNWVFSKTGTRPNKMIFLILISVFFQGLLLFWVVFLEISIGI